MQNIIDKLPRIGNAMLVGVAAAALGSCMVGPDFHRPESPSTTQYTEHSLPQETVSSPGTAGAAQRFVSGADISAQWWALYRSEPLDRLIREAITDSPNLAAAQATLRQAKENLIAGTGSLLYPQVDANLSATREKVSAAQLFGGTGGQSNIFNLYNATVNVSYMLDIFGGNRRELEGLQALVDYQNYQLEGSYLALTSNIVTAAVREAQLRAQISATRDIIAAEEKQLDLTQRQYQLGAVARLGVLALKTELEQTRATLPPLERDLANTRHQLAVLAGRLPSEASLPVFELDTFMLPQELPITLPSELVRQRPDIRASEALLHQASAQIGVATANLYPKITLTGDFGSSTNQFRNFFAGPSVWSIGAGLLQPLFHGGALEAQRRSAIAAYDAANAQYRETVLQAFQNVADALRALEADARTLSAQAEAESAARQTLDLTTRQFQLGGASYLALLIAQRQYQQAKLALAQAQATRFADTAALFQALGGGWWNREANAAASK
ncbi:MAG TPA: efflux transporter outer membrane subunit [Casimicrobiaceae bacterium]|nr:efflux transporter outer membrane subunit [Casimicrobiaceae bacterium]